MPERPGLSSARAPLGKVGQLNGAERWLRIRRSHEKSQPLDLSMIKNVEHFPVGNKATFKQGLARLFFPELSRNCRLNIDQRRRF